MVTFERGSVWRNLRDKLVETGVAANEEPYAVATSIIQRASPAGRSRLLKKYLGVKGMSDNPKRRRRRGRFIKGSPEAKAYMARIRGMVGRAKDRRKAPRKYDGRRWKTFIPGPSVNPVMAYRRRRGRRRRSMTIPMATVLGCVAGVVGPLAQFGKDAIEGNTDSQRELCYHIMRNYTGYSLWNQRWEPEGLKNGIVPAVAGGLVSMLASKLGINRRLGRARVPYFRI